ncbi:hypothetical protein AAMO2058_000546800 [Amorphochlora amoebiformis]
MRNASVTRSTTMVALVVVSCCLVLVKTKANPNPTLGQIPSSISSFRSRLSSHVHKNTLSLSRHPHVHTPRRPTRLSSRVSLCSRQPSITQLLHRHKKSHRRVFKAYSSREPTQTDAGSGTRYIRPLFDNTTTVNEQGIPIPPELTDWLIASQDFRPGKQMSQIYLADESVAINVAEAADVKPGDLVVEIGAGGGSLTRALVKAGAFVIAVEAVSDLARELEKFFDRSTVKVVSQDFLKLNLEELVNAEKERRPGVYKDVKILSNLPYHITTPVLQKVLPLNNVFSKVVLMLQHEAAKRFASAKPHDRDYRFMNFFVDYYSNATYHFKVGRHCYRPNPGVAGGVIEFNLQERSKTAQQTEQADAETLLAFAKLAFQAKYITVT